ncbi:MAG: hypothetical protein GX596_09215, partial [Propionibacterium sp.]|nr:hypothetical protein [Propionibacterium sp.]
GAPRAARWTKRRRRFLVALAAIAVALAVLVVWTNRDALGRAVAEKRLADLSGVASAQTDDEGTRVIADDDATAEQLAAVIERGSGDSSQTLVAGGVTATNFGRVEDPHAAAELIVRVRGAGLPTQLSFADEVPYIGLECDDRCFGPLQAMAQALAGPDAPDALLGGDLVRVRLAQFDPLPVLQVLVAHEGDVESAQVHLPDSEGLRVGEIVTNPGAEAEALEEELLAAQEWDDLRVS